MALTAERLFRLRVKDFHRYVMRQPISFWSITLYMFFEYVRPQQLYPVIDILPWAQSLIIICLISFILEGKFFKFEPSKDGLYVVYALVVLASSMTAWSPEASYDALPLFFSWVVVYLLITNIVTTESRFVVFLVAFFLYNYRMSLGASKGWAMDGFRFRPWGASGAPGWFENSGEFGVEMCIFFPMAFYFVIALKKNWTKRQRVVLWTFPLTALMGMVASSSRGALVGGAGVLLWLLMKSQRRVRALLITGAVSIFLVVITPPEQVERLRTAGDDKTSVKRRDYWRHGREITGQHPILGIGYGNWLPYYQTNYNPQGQLPHNIYIEASAELGLTGLLAFIAMIGGTFAINLKTRRRALKFGKEGHFVWATAHGLDGALVGYLVSGTFVTVLYYPFFWINFAFTVALSRVMTHKLKESRRRVAAGRASPSFYPPAAAFSVAPQDTSMQHP